MTQYERIIALDEHRLTEIGKSTKNILEIYNYLKGTPITTITVAERNLGFSFNTVSKLFHYKAMELLNAIYFPTEIEFFDILNWKT